MRDGRQLGSRQLFPRHQYAKVHQELSSSVTELTLGTELDDSATKMKRVNSYPNISDVLDSMSRAVLKLQSTPHAPQLCEASLRVFRDWGSLTKQLTLNLRCALL